MVYLLVGKTIPKGAQTPRPCFVHIEDPPRVSPQQKQRGAFRVCELADAAGGFCCSAAFFGSLPEYVQNTYKNTLKTPETGANVVIFRRNLLNFCILLIRPKRGQTKRRAARLFRAFGRVVNTVHGAGKTRAPLLPYGGRR